MVSPSPVPSNQNLLDILDHLKDELLALEEYWKNPSNQPDETDLQATQEVLDQAIHTLADNSRIPTEKRKYDIRWLASFPETNPNPIIEVNLAGRITYTNPAAKRIFPDLLEEALGHPYLVGWDELVKKLRRQPGQVIVRDVHIANHWYQQAIFFVAAYNSVRMYGRDITVRKEAEIALQNSNLTLQQQAEELEIQTEELRVQNDELFQVKDQLQQSELILRNYLESMHDMFLALDHDWKMVYINKRFADTINHRAKDLIGKNFWSTFPEFLNTTVEENFHKVMLGRFPVHFIFQGVHRRDWYAVSAYPTNQGLAAFIYDRTEEFKANQALQIARQRTQDLLESIDDGLLGLDRQWCFTCINQKAARNVNREPEELISKNLWEEFPGIMGTDHEIYYRQVMEQRQPAHFEIKGVLTDKFYEIRVFPSNDGITVDWVDITERKQMEMEIVNAERRYRELVQYAPVGIYEIDFRKQRFTSVNDAICLLSGYTREELLAMNPLEIMDRSSQMVFKKRIAQWLSGQTPEQNVEYHVLAKDGHVIFAELNVTFTVDDQGKPLGANVLAYDVTERKKAEQALLEANQRLQNQALELEASKDKLSASNLELAIANNELQERQKDILKSRQIYATILATIQSGYWLLDVDGKLLEVNDAYCRMSGYTQDELLHLQITDLETNENPDEILRHMHLVKKQGHDHFETRHRRKDGSIFDVDIRASYLDVDGGRVAAFSWDITDQKRMERILREREAQEKVIEAVEGERQRLFDVLETLPSMIALLTPDYHVSFANRSFREKFGEAQGRHCYEYCYGQSLPCPFCQTYQVLETGQPQHWQVTTADGSVVDVNDFPFSDLDGSPLILEMDIDITASVKAEKELAVHRDHLEELVEERTSLLENANRQLKEEIIERQKAEQVLRASQNRLETVFKAIPNVLLEYDTNLTPVRVNAAAMQALGMPALDFNRDQAVNQLHFSHLDGSPVEKDELPTSRALRGESASGVLYTIRTADGVDRTISAHTAPIYKEDGAVDGVVASWSDITELKQVEAHLQKALLQAEEGKRLLEALMEYVPEGITIADAPDEMIRMVSRYGDDLIGAPHLQRTIEDVANEWKVYDQDGITPLPNDRLPLSRAIRKAEIVRNQDIVQINTKGQHLFLSCNAGPICDAAGNVTGAIVTWRDITDRKQLELQLREVNEQLEERVRERTAELQVVNHELLLAQTKLKAQNKELLSALETEKSLRNQLIQAEKYTALARLVGSVAHEINNPLQTVKNCMYLMRMEALPDPALEDLELADAELLRVSNLIDQLRETYRPSHLKPVDFNLVDMINRILMLLSPQLRQSKIQWRFHPNRDRIIVHGISDQIQQVCLNICLNAIDAMVPKGGGQLEISLSTLAEEHKVLIAFHDTGIGISEEVAAQIFEPFFTTKKKGTGLGLSIVYEIVKAHGGEITLESQLGEGATFTVWLPIRS